MSNHSMLCPKCNHSDMVRKVSAIVKDLATVRGEYGPVPQITELIRELQPPEQPKANAACLFFLGIFSIPILVYLYVFSTIGEGVSSFTIILLLFLGLVIFGVIAMIRQSQAKMPNWEHAMDKWNQLYCCTRDDIIFNPDDRNSGYMPATRKIMLDYLYKKSVPSQKPPPSQENEERKVIIRCENCKQKLLIPLRRKNIHVTCPKCRHEFNYEYMEGEPVDD